MDEGLGIFLRWPKKGKVEGERKWELRELRRDEDGMESFGGKSGWGKWNKVEMWFFVARQKRG